MLTPEKAGQLSALLRSLPEHTAVRLAKAVEFDCLAGGTLLPHAVILDALRPSLRKARAADRVPTPLRLFCQPFEDLLDDAPRKEKRKGRIARASILPVWAWLSDTLAPAEVKAYSEKFTGGARPYSEASAFWPVAADALQAPLGGDRKEARRALGGDLALADAGEMALLLSVADHFIEIQKLLPHGTPALGDEALHALCVIYNSVEQATPDAAPYVAVTAMNRLERPWEALKLALQITHQSSDTLISSTDIGLAGEVLFADLDSHAAVIRAARHPQFDATALALHVGAFAKISNGLAQEVDLRREGVWHRRLMKDRKSVADTMEALMERAPREILAALPVHKTGSYGGGPKAPDIARAPDPDRSERGLRYAHLVVACRNFAAAASFGAAQKAAFDEASVHLKSYADGIVREMRAAEEPAKRVIAEQYFALAADFAAILFSAEEAEFLRRRARAASSAAA